MKRGYRHQFTYTKADGSRSNRDVIVLSVPSDSYLTIDLSEFDDENKEYFHEKLAGLIAELDEEVADLIGELGLKSCYRRFKAEGISYEK